MELERKMENEYIFFPISKKGYWHNGIHRYKKNAENTVFSSFFGMVLIKSQNVLPKVFPSIIPKFIKKGDIEIKNPYFIEKKGYENELFIKLSKLSKEEKEEVLDAIGLSSIPTYILQKHVISFDGNSFIYYSFARHLSKLYEFKKILNREYVFPHNRLGDYGESESEKNMFHQEYFITVNSDFFKIDNSEIYDYCFITNNFQPYQVMEQDYKLLYFEKETKFSTINTEKEYRENLHSLHLQIKEMPVRLSSDYYDEKAFKIKISNFEIKIYDEQNNLVNPLTAEIMNPFTGNFETIAVKSEYLRAVNLQKIFCIEDRFNLHDFWTNADNAILKQWDKNTIVKTTATLKAFDFPPDRKKFFKSNLTCENLNFQFFKVQEADCISVFRSIDNKKFIQICNEGENYYFSYNDIRYSLNCWKDFKKSTVIFFEGDLKSFNVNDSDDYKTCVDFQNILKKKNIIDNVSSMQIEEFLRKNRNKLLKCAFQHISEWSLIKQKLNPFKNNDLLETAELWKNLHIWGTSGKSSGLPREIADSSKFIYFHPEYFENWLFTLHRCYARKLKTVQNIIMEDWRMKQGNCGMYYNAHNDSQIFCNQAVFETLKLVDENWTNFTNRNSGAFPEFDLNEYKRTPAYKSQIDEIIKKDTGLKKELKYKAISNAKKIITDYPYKKSNYWCDVLELQCQKERSGIKQITVEQAFYMAQLGYVVIGCWKNTSKNGSPHFVTVRPCDGVYSNIETIKVANVGSNYTDINNVVHYNEVRSLPRAFLKNSLSDIKFYFNIEQAFK